MTYILRQMKYLFITMTKKNKLLKYNDIIDSKWLNIETNMIVW